VLFLGSVVVEVVTQPCTLVVFGLIDKLEHRFPTLELMNAIRAINLQYWCNLKLNKNIWTNVQAHLNILKPHYYFGKTIRLKQMFISTLLDGTLLVKQLFFFKTRMFANSHVAMRLPCSWIWCTLATNQLLPMNYLMCQWPCLCVV
jgi:hypothetical protein